MKSDKKYQKYIFDFFFFFGLGARPRVESFPKETKISPDENKDIFRILSVLPD